MESMTSTQTQVTSEFLGAVAYGGSIVHAIRDRPAERVQMGLGNLLLSGPALCGVRGSAGGYAWGFRLQGGHENPTRFDPADAGSRTTYARCVRLHREDQK